MKLQVKRVTLTLVVGVLSSVCFAQDFGHFVGKVVTEWLPDGRKMKLAEPFAYVDPTGVTWDAPKGWIVDGASIPRIAWSLIGGPYEGPYRNASVIHDVACDQRQRPWRDVHRAFYMAMLAENVGSKTAKIMYGAVYRFGPRWERQVTFPAVPIENVEPTIDRLRATAGPGEYVQTEVNPIRRVGGCPEGLACDVGVELPPVSANVTARFTPELPTAIGDQSETFQRLKLFIESNDPPLEAIEQFR